MKKNTLWFAAIILASALLWQMVFSSLRAPKPWESLQLFVTADTCDSAKIKTDLESLPVQKISIFSHSITGTHYNDYLTTIGVQSSDLLIVDSSIFDLEYTWQEFAPLNADLLSGYGLVPDSYHFITVNGTNYAIVIHDEALGISLLGEYLTVCEPGSRYCIAVNRNTPNAAPYSSDAQTTDHAFRALAMLLG